VSDKVDPTTPQRSEIQRNGGNRPVPDPTVLTTQQTLREVSMLRDVLETRLTGMDKAIQLLQGATDKFPALIESSVYRLQALHDEKFKSIALQFSERDVRTEQTSRDNNVALTAALQAAKEAVGEQNKSNVLANTKSEAAFTKLIDQLSVLIDRTDKSLSDKIEDSKERIGVIEKNANERLTAMESHSKGSRDTSHDIWGYLVGFGGLVIAAIVLFMKATGH
jgi:hypothetical protein